MFGISDDALLRLHAEVLFDIDQRGGLVRLNEPDGDPAPRLFLARGRTTTLAWYRADLPEATVARCASIVAELPPWDGREPTAAVHDPLRTALGKDAPITEVAAGPAYRFSTGIVARTDVDAVLIDEASAELLDGHFPYTRSVLAWRSPVVVVVRDGVAVSACYCARKRATAAEAGVATIGSFRGLGLATAVTAAWRRAVERLGMTPLYSTSWDNIASRRVAERLGLITYADTFSLT
jgi:hypothetical protein